MVDFKTKIRPLTRNEYIQSILGAVIFAVGVNFFVVPSGIYSGGVLGLSQLLYALVKHVAPGMAKFNFTSILYYLLNAPLFFLSYRVFSRNFFFRNVLCVTVETIALALIPIPKNMLVDSVLTSTIIGGLIVGTGAGLIFRARSSAGGTDIIGMVLTQKYRDFSVGRLSLSVNAVIYTICALTMDVSVAIYSIIYSVFMNMMVDRIHEQNICTEITIFTKKDPHPIVEFITDELHHSANYWEGTSAFTGEKDFIIYTVVSKYEAHKLDAFLYAYDDKTFAVKNNGVALHGNFKKHL